LQSGYALLTSEHLPNTFRTVNHNMNPNYQTNI
ncbi:MAG: hypothetical protein ACI81V_000061, partial [Lentimonas sp.]